MKNSVSDISVAEHKVESVEEVKTNQFSSLLYESQAMTLEVRAGLENS